MRIEGIVENRSYSTTREDHKIIFEPHPSPKNWPLVAQKVKNDPECMSKSKVRIEGNIENKNCSAIWAVFKPYPGCQ